MSLVASIREMLDRGLSIDQALTAAEIIEAQTEPVDTRSPGAKRQARYRERKRNESVTQRNEASRVTSRYVTPSKQKETFPPTPPLLEKLNHPISEADASLVDEPVDVNEINEIGALRKQRVALCQTVVALWNELAASNRMVAVRDITATRQAVILARSEDLTKTYDFPDAIAGWRKLMGLVRGSPFLRGELNGFRCDFDFVTRASSFTKIMEGKYEARAPTRR